MFGLEKKEKGLFQFDLEKEWRKDPQKARELLKLLDTRVQAVKTSLRQGADATDFELLSALLNAYTALQRVVTRTTNKK